MKNYYQVLGLDQSATAKQIKTAYRELCKLYHPDLNRSADANARIQEINEAYRVLSSPMKKAEYDQLLRLREQQGETNMDGASASGHTTHCRCEKCGRVDSTLRVTVFTWVISLLVISFRRGWAKILCARCRIKYALLFDLQNFFMGWWGFPFGILWTFEALCQNSMGGQQPEENNALFLAGLGYELYAKGDIKAAVKVLEASLKLRKDLRVEAFYWQVKAKLYETPAGATAEAQASLWQRLATGALHPALYCAPLIALLFWLGHLLFESENKPPTVAGRAAAIQRNSSHLDTAHLRHDANSNLSTRNQGQEARSDNNSVLRARSATHVDVKPWEKDPEVGPEVYEEFGVQYFENGEYKEALNALRRAAIMGRAKAQYYLGGMYRSGRGVKESDSEAAKWYAKAVRRGYLPAFHFLANQYRFGSGLEKNLKEAFRLSRIAGEAGDAAAQFELGQLYQFGEGAAKDEREAEKWYRRAADQGDAYYQYKLGEFYFFRWFDLRNDDSPHVRELLIEELKWKILAAKQGHEEATHTVASARETLRNTNDWLKTLKGEDADLPGRKERIAEAFRRAASFVVRRESTNEWLAATEWIDGSNLPVSSGTGFFISEDGYLLTNFHVIEDGMRIVVQCGRNTYTAALVKADPVNDLAVLKVAGKFRAIPPGPSRIAKLGDSVFTVGFPNPQLQGVAPKLTDGKISSLSGMQDDARQFQISVAVQPGNSGGALVNSAGNVIGIVTARLSEEAAFKTSGALPQNVNYAIKSSYVLSLLESLPEVASKLKEPWPAKERKFEDVVKEAQEAAALILVY